MNVAQTALADQAEAAHHHAVDVLRRTGDCAKMQFHDTVESPWLADLVNRVASAPPRAQSTCRHLANSASPQIVFLIAHRRRLECARCAQRALVDVPGTREDRTCDCCRRLIPRGQVEVIACVIGTVLVTAGHCTSCRPIVLGTPAVTR